MDPMEHPNEGPDDVHIEDVAVEDVVLEGLLLRRIPWRIMTRMNKGPRRN